MKLIVKWLLAACALLLVAYLYPGVQVQNFTSALIAALVIGLFNMVLRPIPARHAGSSGSNPCGSALLADAI